MPTRSSLRQGQNRGKPGKPDPSPLPVETLLVEAE